MQPGQLGHLGQTDMYISKATFIVYWLSSLLTPSILPPSPFIPSAFFPARDHALYDVRRTPHVSITSAKHQFDSWSPRHPRLPQLAKRSTVSRSRIGALSHHRIDLLKAAIALPPVLLNANSAISHVHYSRATRPTSGMYCTPWRHCLRASNRQFACMFALSLLGIQWLSDTA